MNLNIKVIKKRDYLTSNWSGGTTSEILIYPEDSVYKELKFNYRISSATVELESSDFTSLPNVNRFITPLDGELKLTHDGENFTNLQALEVYEFDGGIETTSYGKVRDFNLMLANSSSGKLYRANKDSKLSIDKNKHIIIFNYNNQLELSIENKIYNLDKMDSLIITTDNKSEEDIELNLTSKDSELKVLISEVEI